MKLSNLFGVYTGIAFAEPSKNTYEIRQMTGRKTFKVLGKLVVEGKKVLVTLNDWQLVSAKTILEIIEKAKEDIGVAIDSDELILDTCDTRMAYRRLVRVLADRLSEDVLDEILLDKELEETYDFSQ